VVIGASKIARDITARKQIEVERAALLGREYEARKEIERASRLKDEFLAVLSHELRTPLNAVLGYAQLLSSAGLSSERAQHAVKAILRNAQAQTRLVESLLDLSRVVAGKLELDLQSHDLGAILEAALEVVRADAEAKGVDFERFKTPVPVFVLGDATRLQQVFWNLFSNAVKFTPRGGRVSIRSRARDTVAVVEVTDTGAGISADFLPYMFDRFKQADGRTQSRGGLGLGLAVAREMVQAHGGTIVAESQGEGLGSTFLVTLPLATGAVTDDGVRTAPAFSIERLLGHLDILIVDDDEDARDLLALILESRGADTRSVASAAEALDSISRHAPSLLLSDLRMPSADGYSLIRQVRAAEDGHGRLPAIAVSANAGVAVRQQAIAAGYDVHVCKPVDATELTRAIIELTTRDGV
jgi:CheY-like chemotaxis protein